MRTAQERGPSSIVTPAGLLALFLLSSETRRKDYRLPRRTGLRSLCVHRGRSLTVPPASGSDNAPKDVQASSGATDPLPEGENPGRHRLLRQKPRKVTRDQDPVRDDFRPRAVGERRTDNAGSARCRYGGSRDTEALIALGSVHGEHIGPAATEMRSLKRAFLAERKFGRRMVPMWRPSRPPDSSTTTAMPPSAGTGTTYRTGDGQRDISASEGCRCEEALDSYIPWTCPLKVGGILPA